MPDEHLKATDWGDDTIANLSSTSPGADIVLRGRVVLYEPLSDDASASGRLLLTDGHGRVEVALGHRVVSQSKAASRAGDTSQSRLESQSDPESQFGPSDDAPAIGSWIRIEGRWTGTKVCDAELFVLNAPIRAFPDMGGDWVRLQDGPVPRIDRLRSRARMLRAIRSYFDESGALEVETPLAVPSPGVDPHIEAFEVLGGPAPRWLITSPEYQMKRLLAGGSGSIYQLCKCFRRDEVGSLHQPEFTMLEWYRVNADAQALRRDTEAMIIAAARALNTPLFRVADRESDGMDLRAPWPEVRVEDAFLKYTGLPLSSVVDDETRFFQLWVDQVEPHLGHGRPVFITHFPASMASLARLCPVEAQHLPEAQHLSEAQHPPEPRWADRFELYINSVELCNGFHELIDPVEQRARFMGDRETRAARGLPPYPIDERFLSALEEGLPPCAGNALGIDRLLMLLLDTPGITDVMSFSADEL